MSLDIKKPQTSLPVKYIIEGHLWTPVILPTISTGSIHWSLWSIPWFCLISTVNPGCFEKGVFFTIPVSKKLITKTMGIHQTPTTLWVESHDGFRCIYSWLRGRVITTHLHGSEPRVFFSVPGIEPQELHTLVPKFIFQETLLGQIPCIYNYIYMAKATESQWFGMIIWRLLEHPNRMFRPNQSERQNESRRWVQTSPRNSWVPLCLTQNMVGIYVMDDKTCIQKC